MYSRRAVLWGMSSAVAVATTNVTVASPAAPDDAAEADTAAGRFSFDWLADRMRAAAERPYETPAIALPDIMARLNYDQYRSIAYRPERALWGDGGSDFRLHAFHMGWLFKEPVRLFEIVDGRAEPVTFTGADFEYRPPLDAEAFESLVMPGVAGFRLHYPLNRPDVLDELIVFQGASYFRALAPGNVYGLSARGLAVNTATGQAEEFPRFSDFYIERPGPGQKEMVIYAALDSPSVTGAYAFRIVPGEVTTTDVTARLFFRADIERLGIAPLTSMFLFSANNRAAFDDYRIRVHDSEGLKIVRPSGEEAWRCLNNPAVLANSIFRERSPLSFGLYQRSRGFGDYQDAEAWYNKRPSVRVEPLGDWGSGTIELIEIPIVLEKDDNIVAFWTPEARAARGGSMEVSYRLSWGNLEFAPRTIAHVAATRSGIGGVSGKEDEERGLRKFVVDFRGGSIGSLPADTPVTAMTQISGGEIARSTLSPVISEGIWRLALDVRAVGAGPIEMSAYLAMADRPVSETWLYQWRPDDLRFRGSG